MLCSAEFDLAYSSDDARVLMSYEHRALGFRPPPGSLAAQVQGVIASAKNDNTNVA